MPWKLLFAALAASLMARLHHSIDSTDKLSPVEKNVLDAVSNGVASHVLTVAGMPVDNQTPPTGQL
jgi:hypothetical protein